MPDTTTSGNVSFDAADWIARLAAALEDVAAQARPSFPFSLETPHYGPLDEYWSSIRRQYQALAARAKHDPAAAQHLAQSHLWLTSDPVKARAILREHPLLRPGLIGSSKREGIGFILPTRDWFYIELKSLIAHLAKRAMQESGEQAAQLLHRYLTAGAAVKLPAHEITILHGLTLERRCDLGSEAYLAPYADVKAAHGLPELPANTRSNPAALVRGLRWGPGVAPPPDEGDSLKVQYRFPGDCESPSNVLVDLLSISTRSPLLAHARFFRVARWIEALDPNFAADFRHSSAYLPNATPKERPFSQSDAAAFAALASRWRAYRGRRDVIDLAIRRLAASFARVGGPFSAEDCILDVSIALEIMYGPIKQKLALELAARAEHLLGQGMDQVKSFYEVRSAIVHGKKKIKGGRAAIDKALEDGRDLACLTLSALLSRGPIRNWDDPL